VEESKLSASPALKVARFPRFPDVATSDEPKSPVADAIHAVREAARLEGFARGYDEGRAAAIAEWTERLRALATSLENTISGARADRERLVAEVSETLPRVVVDLAQKIIDADLASEEDRIRAAVTPITRRLAEGGAVAVRVSADVADTIARWRGTPDAAPFAGVIVRIDHTLKRGDWIIETEGGFLDGRIATQLEEAWRVLAESA
jgi:flagellar biosynthesis/type III secretory pathway protein FliH